MPGTIRKHPTTRPSHRLTILTMGLLHAIVTVFSFGITLAIFMPIAGVITRFRANYTPKGLGLGENDDDEQRLSQGMSLSSVSLSSVAHMAGRPSRWSCRELSLGYGSACETYRRD